MYNNNCCRQEVQFDGENKVIRQAEERGKSLHRSSVVCNNLIIKFSTDNTHRAVQQSRVRDCDIAVASNKVRNPDISVFSGHAKIRPYKSRGARARHKLRESRSAINMATEYSGQKRKGKKTVGGVVIHIQCAERAPDGTHIWIHICDVVVTEVEVLKPWQLSKCPWRNKGDVVVIQASMREDM